MAELQYLGNPVLREKCKEITEITDETRHIAKELIRIVKEKNGAGLAAPQIGYPVRMYAVWITDERHASDALEPEPTIFINPVVTKQSSKKIVLEEGCLSIPTIFADVERSEIVTVKALDVEGNTFTEKNVGGWRARCILHEQDHIDGILFIDHLNEEKRQELDGALKFIELKHKKPH